MSRLVHHRNLYATSQNHKSDKKESEQERKAVYYSPFLLLIVCGATPKNALKDLLK